MYVIIENTLLFFALYFSLMYNKFPEGFFARKLFVFLIVTITSLAIQMLYNLIMKASLPLNDLIIKSIMVGLIGTLGYSLMNDIINENLLPAISTMNKNILIPASVIMMNILVQIIQLVIKSNYLLMS